MRACLKRYAGLVRHWTRCQWGILMGAGFCLSREYVGRAALADGLLHVHLLHHSRGIETSLQVC